MSWLFGNLGKGSNQVTTDLDLQNLHGFPTGGPLDDRSNQPQDANEFNQQQQQIKVASGYEFDSTGLEHAAKSARELEKTKVQKILIAIGGITLTVAGFYTAKYSIRIVGRHIESRIAKPSLVRETSRLHLTSLVSQPIQTIKRLFGQQSDALKDVILNPKLEAELRDLSIDLCDTKEDKGTFRNFVFHGPPGTGKTFSAKNLSHYSGMDYAIISGFDVAPLGKEAVTEIHKLFYWAKTSRKGLIVFIDDADAFLKERNTLHANQNLLRCLNAFLYHTHTPSKNFLVILASDRPDDFDSEIIDECISEFIQFDKPSLEERQRLVRLYFDKYILEPASQNKSRLKVANFDYDKACSKIAEMTKGLSASEIKDLAEKLQATADTSKDGVLTEDLMMSVVKNASTKICKKKLKPIDFQKYKLDYMFSQSNRYPMIERNLEILEKLINESKNTNASIEEESKKETTSSDKSSSNDSMIVKIK